MKPEIIYEQVNRWCTALNGQIDQQISAEMLQIIELSKTEMLDNVAKKSGDKYIVSAAKRIIQNAERVVSNKPGFHGMFINQSKDGSSLYCVCDTYRAVRFNKMMPLQEIDTNNCTPIELSNICLKVDNAVEIKLPNIVDVKLASKDVVINDKKKVPKPYCIDKEIGLWVNPQYLLDMMECLPNAKVYAGNSKQLIYFRADNGDGVLCPINHNDCSI